MAGGLSCWICLFAGLCFIIVDVTWAEGVVEGFQGGDVVLPCAVSTLGDVRWRGGATTGDNILLIRTGGEVLKDNTAWREVISLVGSSNNLSISSLSRQRDDGVTFRCEGTGPARGQQETTVRVLVRITETRIEQASEGQVTLTEGTPKTLTCVATGIPNPAPSYSWTLDNGGIAGKGSNYTLSADRSMQSVSCTATNNYSNGSVLSTASGTATLNVLYLDTPSTGTSITVIENEIATLRCSAQGTPKPSFQWRRSESAEVKSTLADYRIENVQRSAAGEYSCAVSNSVGTRQTSVELIVQSPSDVKVAYDQRTQTLTCTAEGIPDVHTFSPWEHRLGGILLRRLGAQTNGISATHTLPDTMTYRDTGDYVCSATNGVKSLQRGLTYVAPLTPAVFENHTEEVRIGLGKSLAISTSFYARSSSGTIRTRWQKADASDALQFHREESGPVRLEMYGQTVTLLGTVTVLTLTDVQQADEGNYTVIVVTDINGVTQTSSTSFYVYVTNKPSTEKDMAVVDTESNTSETVAWVLVGLLVVVTSVLIVVVVIIWRRLKTQDVREGIRNRQMSPAVEISGEERTLPKVADTPSDPAENIDHNYESLAHNMARNSGSRDQHYESMTSHPLSGDNTYENTEETSARQSGDQTNYQNV